MATDNTLQPLPPEDHSSLSASSNIHDRSRGKEVTQARARAQRTKLEAQSQARTPEEPESDRSSSGEKPQEGHARKRKQVTLQRAIQDYLDDHEGGNHSDKTIEWHETALGLLRHFLEEGRGITLVVEVDAPDISAWFTSMRKTPGARGKIAVSGRSRPMLALLVPFFTGWCVRV